MSDIPEGPHDGQETIPPVERTQTDRALALVLAVLLFVLFLLVCVPVQMLNLGFGLWFTEVFVILGVTWILLRMSGRDPLHYPRAQWPGARLAALGFLAGTVNFVALVVPLQSLAEALAPEKLKHLYDQTQIFKHQAPLELALIVSGVGIAAPVCEEYFFRGVLQRGLGQWLRPGVAIALAAFIFSAFHLDPLGFAGRWELGILFGYLFYKTGSLWPGVAAHAANNLVSTSLYFLFKDMDEKGADQGPPAAMLAVMVLIGVPILTSVLRAAAHLAPEAVKEEPRPTAVPPPFLHIALPWFLAAAVSLALLLAVDYRGVELNIDDQVRVPLPDETENAPAWEKQERAELERLRKAARAGKVSIDDYVTRRRELARKLGGPAPAPPRPQPVPSPTSQSKR